MSKRIVFCALAVLLIAGFVVARGGDKTSTWTGVISDDHCGYKAKHSAECVNGCVKNHGAKYALVDATDKKVYILDPQTGAAEHANETVKVTGTVDGNTIKVTKIEAVK